MNVIAYDIRPRPELTGGLGFRYVAFEELLAGSDIISLHANLNHSSYHILNREAFAKCRPGVVIINTARGKLIAHLKTIAPKRARRIGPAEGCSGKRKLIDRGLAFPASAI